MSASQVDVDETGEAPRAESAETLGGLLSKPVAEQDEASLTLVVLRDVAVAAALLSLFGAAEAWAQVSGLAFASLVATIDGLLVGAATCALAHEWGHFAGARLGGGHAPLKKISAFPQLFDFDYRNNEQRAFDWMSYGGNIAHVAVPIVYLLAIGATAPGTSALIAGAVGFAVFSSIIEWPVIANCRRGMSGPEALGKIPRNFVQKTLPWALGATALTFLIV